MIDTDKYEGHLPFTGDELVWVWSKSGMNRMKSVKQFNVTAQLLQDAPLLLEEVKRLREKCVMLDVIINKMQGTTVFDNAVYETHKHFHLSNECLDVCLVCMEMIE